MNYFIMRPLSYPFLNYRIDMVSIIKSIHIVLEPRVVRQILSADRSCKSFPDAIRRGSNLDHSIFGLETAIIGMKTSISDLFANLPGEGIKQKGPHTLCCK